MSFTSVALGEVATVNPRSPSKGELSADTEVDFVPMASVSEGGEMTVAEQRTYEEVSKGFTPFKRDDVLVAKITPCYENNKIAKATTTTDFAFGSTEFHVLRADTGRLHPDYLTYFLRQDHIRDAGERRMTGSGGQRRVPKSFLEELAIPLPPLEEQKRIAGILDEAARLCRLRTRALDTLNTLGQAIFHEMFGDATVESSEYQVQTLGDLLDAIDSGKSPKCLDRPASTTEVGILKLSAVTSGRFMPEENKSYDGSFPLDPRHQVRDGDLLFTRKNTMALVAAVALVRGAGDRQLYLPDLIFRLRPKSDAPIRLQYLSHLLAHPAKRAQVQALAGGAAGSMPNISKAKLMNVAIPVPPMDVQIAFENRLAECERMEGSVRSGLDQANTLFASLQHRAFRGDL